MEHTFLTGQEDKYQGIIISPKGFPNDKKEFESILIKTLEFYKEKGKRSVWLKIEEQRSELIKIAIKQGFKFHHTKNNILVLNKWLLEDIQSTLPNYATHYIGVGGLVYDQQKQRILMIQDKNKHFDNIWKLPGGLVDFNESIQQAVIREVKEETGINCTFQKVLCFRETSSYQFDCPDIYFVCLLFPLDFDILIQESEIKDCQWVDVSQIHQKFNLIPIQKMLRQILSQFFANNNLNAFDSHTYQNSRNNSVNTFYYPDVYTLNQKDKSKL